MTSTWSANSVNRRQILVGSGLLTAAISSSAVLNAATATGDSSATPKQFFIAARGDDGADGLTPKSAWQTLQKAAIAVPPNSILSFRRGDEYYGELNLPADCEINAYGEGPLPILSKFKILRNPACWVRQSPGVWRIDLSSPETHDGYTSIPDANIGYLRVGDRIYANRKNAYSELNEPWDFLCDLENHLLYVAATENPAVGSDDVLAAARGKLDAVITCSSGNNTVRDIQITGTGGHGICGSGSDVHIHDCTIDHIGGSYLPGFRNGKVRYGNAIENWRGATRWLIENNSISQTYDAAYTAQGNADPARRGWNDIKIRLNHIYQCGQSFELWTKGAQSDGEIAGMVIEKNYCEAAGYSPLSKFRPNIEIGVHMLTYSWDLPADITVKSNVFNSARSAYCYHATTPIGLVSGDNDIRLRARTIMQAQMSETIEQADAWRTANSVEMGSKFTILP